MSHEIRTPLNGVLGLLQLVLAGDLEDGVRADLETMRTSARGLLELLNDILDLAKLEAGRVEADRVEFDLTTLVEDVVELFGESTQRKGVELYAAFGAGMPRCVVGDPRLLRQALTNLVGNAVKFTANGSIAVTVAWRPSAQGAHLSIAVADTGIGIPDEQQARLFQPFTQADASTTRRYGGTGLGLFLARRVAECLGGGIRVVSAPDVGSTFTIEVEVGLPDIERNAIPWPTRQRLFVLDAAPGVRDALSAELGAAGVPVRVAANVEDSLRWLRADGGADLVVVDARTIRELPDVEALRAAAGPNARFLLVVGAEVAPAVAPWCSTIDAVARRPLRRSVLDRLLATLGGEASELSRRPTPPEPLPRVRAHVLLAEDNPINQKVALRTLERIGCSAVLVQNGAEAVARAANEAFDVILMDCQMPVLDGLAATRAIRALPGAAARVPIVAMTANALHGDRELCLGAGMDDYLAKPVQLRELAATVERWSLRGPGAIGR